MTGSGIDSGWEALRADPLPWLLGDDLPNLRWRALVELVGRDPDSPAVQRARGGADAAEPVASLLEPLLPDGRWQVRAAAWHRYRGPGWRLVAALDAGADPTDPRLQAAAGRLLEAAVGAGGLAPRAGLPPDPVVTARAVQALADLGWGGHLRVQEALAWLEEEGLPAARGASGATTAVATLRAAATLGRRPLQESAESRLREWLGRRTPRRGGWYGHPRLADTDELEALWALARGDAPWHEAMRGALVRLQHAADAAGRWWRRVPAPRTLAGPAAGVADLGPSPFLTLRAVVAVTHFAVEARLPRLFPQPPEH